MNNSLGTKPIRTLVLTNGLPLMISLFVSNLYNFVDSIFVSRIAEKALTALSLASPIQVAMSALGLANAVGLNAAISRALGEKSDERVRHTAAAAIWLIFVFWICLAGASLVVIRPYFMMQAGNDMEIVEYGMEYLSVIMLFSLGVMGQWVFDRFTIASGKSSLFLITLSSGAITNIILDPIMIFGLLGFPAMGVRGAAIATVIGQAVGALMGVFINRKYNREIPLSVTLLPDFECVGEILRVGIPSAVSQIMLSVMGMYVNNVLIGFSSTAVAVYGACSKVQSLSLVPVWGLNNGLIPLVAYNYGAGRTDRSYDSIRWSMIYEYAFFIVVLIVLELFPAKILGLFDASAEMLAIGIPAMRILGISYLISIVSLCLASSFQGFGRGTDAMVLTLLRQTVLLFIFLTIFRSFGSVKLIWAAYICSEVCSIPAGLFLFRRIQKGIA